MHTVLLKGGHLVDPLQGIDGIRDILIRGDKIALVAPRLTGEEIPGPQDCTHVDIAGLLVLPGLIDLHVHLREPGQEQKETIASGCAAAVSGGFTALACMANTDPVLDTGERVEWILQKAQELPHAPRVYPVGALTRGLSGLDLADLAGMAERGVLAFSDDGKSIASAACMSQAMKAVRGLGRQVFSHCEDADLAMGHMNEGETARRLGIPGSPGTAETLLVARDILLCSYTRCPLHIQHVTTAEAVEIIAWAKGKGLPVTAEATPHHLLLTDAAVAEYGGDAKMNPPLRSDRDRMAVVKGLHDGIIDCIATDHAPHTPAEKAREFSDAPFGVVGLETALPAVITGLVETGILSMGQLVDRFCIAPARILGIPGGTLAAGSDADITVVDLKQSRVVDRDSFRSKGRNTPFQGKTLRGWPVMTVLKGNVVEL